MYIHYMYTGYRDRFIEKANLIFFLKSTGCHYSMNSKNFKKVVTN